MVLEPPSGDCEGPSRWMHVGSRESKEERTISCRDSPPVGSGSVPRETPMSAELRIVSPCPELCVPLPPGTEPASRQARTTAGHRGGPLHSQQAHRFPVKRQVGSAGRQLRCSASPSPSRAVDRGAPSHQKGSPPDVAGEASRRTCSARCALSAPFVARGTAVWIIQPSGGTAGAVASPVPHDQRLTRCPRGVEASSVGPERMRIPSKGACLRRDAVCRETPLPVHGRARGIAEGTTPRAAEAYLNRSGEFHSEHGAVMVDGPVEPVRASRT